MPAVSEAIVREYFELHGFFVRQRRKFVAPTRVEDDEIDFFVLNPNPASGGALPFELSSADLPGLARAAVVVKGWHSETFSAALMTHEAEMFRFLEPVGFQQATKSFGGEGPLTKLLVVPALPAHEGARQQSLDMLKAKGLDGVILFRTMLADLIEHVPTKNIGVGQFVIGTSKVRPRVDDVFKRDEKMGIYFKIYNFGTDGDSRLPEGSVSYEVVKNSTQEKIFEATEDVAKIPGASANQVTIEKLLPLKDLAPGQYTLRVKITDKNRNQVLTPSAQFTVT